MQHAQQIVGLHCPLGIGHAVSATVHSVHLLPQKDVNDMKPNNDGLVSEWAREMLRSRRESHRRRFGWHLDESVRPLASGTAGVAGNSRSCERAIGLHRHSGRRLGRGLCHGMQIFVAGPDDVHAQRSPILTLALHEPGRNCLTKKTIERIILRMWTIMTGISML
jgi:hypothetical protein